MDLIEFVNTILAEKGYRLEWRGSENDPAILWIYENESGSCIKEMCLLESETQYLIRNGYVCVNDVSGEGNEK